MVIKGLVSLSVILLTGGYCIIHKAMKAGLFIPMQEQALKGENMFYIRGFLLSGFCTIGIYVGIRNNALIRELFCYPRLYYFIVID